MKNIFLLFFAVLFTANLSAQTKRTPNANQAKVKKAQATYSLDEQQTITYIKIVQRFSDNLADIKSLEATNPELYQKKIKSIVQGNDFSVKKMLNAQQLKIYQAEKLEKRKARAAYATKLKEQGKTNDEKRKAMIEWELGQ